MYPSENLGRGLGRGTKAILALALIAGAQLGSWGASGGPSAAFAAAPERQWTACDAGPNDIQCGTPRGVAADRSNGHVFVADQVNRRVVEFDSLGNLAKAWGWDVVASGPGDEGTGFEICVVEDGDVCKTGVQGGGAGQFAIPSGVAIDSAGDVYVADKTQNRRVQKFSPEGDFVLTFGADVNKTKVDEVAPEAERNVCPVDAGDVCQGGIGGTGAGEFLWPVAGSFVAISGGGTPTTADDIVYVGDQNRLQAFDTNGIYQGECAVPGTVQSLATDSAGDLYVGYSLLNDIRKLTPACVELLSPRFAVSLPTAVAVDAAGHVFAFGPVATPGGPIFEFEAAGSLAQNFGEGEFSGSTGLAANLCSGSPAPGNVYATNASTGIGTPGVEAGPTQAFVRAYGTPPVGCINVVTGPATSIGESTATLEGTVNPEGAAVTECRFEYGPVAGIYGQSAPCAQTEGDIGTGTDPVPVDTDISGLDPGTVYHFRLVAKVGGVVEKGSDGEFKTFGPPIVSAEHTVGATDTEITLKALVNPEGLATACHFEYGLDETYGQSSAAQSVGADGDRGEHAVVATVAGLAPDTTYHWRIVCSNASDTAGGANRTATTYRPVALDTCPANQVFRSGDGALLPDCRAYEMVSPVDKGGGDIVRKLAGVADPGSYVQASPTGDRITYTAPVSFGDQPNSFDFNQYLATREAGTGWASHGIHPPVTGKPADTVLFGLIREFMAFSPDLCSAWLVDFQTPPPTTDGQEGFRNLYRRENCAPSDGLLEAMAPDSSPLPEGTNSEDYVDNRSVQGVSDDSRHAVFVVRAKLVPDAAPGTNGQIYDRFDGALSLVSVLPDGSPNPTGAVVGSGWTRNLDNAVSRDGSRVYWTAGVTQGQIYVRTHPEQGVTEGECEAGKACTIPVSNSSGGFFLAAAADGSRAIFSEGDLSKGEGDIYEFDLEEAEEGEPPQLVVEDIRGVAGASEDLSRIYFVSEQALGGAGPNSEGDSAQAGEPNLYLIEAGGPQFVATLLESDLGKKEPGSLVEAYDLVGQTYLRATRVTPDGAHIAFQSRRALTGYDNTDEDSGKPAVEVFRYEAEGDLLCVSCNPSGAWPQGAKLEKPYGLLGEGEPTGVIAAAFIPTWEHPLHASGVLAENGGRLFFNSNDALLPRDTNGETDVYEWEAAGSGSCDAGDPDYFTENGGCLYLISSGESPFESQFWEATPDGSDVFFTTASSLLPRDPGLVDLYDARVGGGIEEPVSKTQCEGEACQSPPPPPDFSTPSSASFSGPGDSTQRRRCPKGKRRVRRGGKSRCVKRRTGRRGGKRRGDTNRRARP